jgi:hypothetical protein
MVYAGKLPASQINSSFGDPTDLIIAQEDSSK